MVIKASSRKQVDSLVAALGAADALERDTAITRLTVIGGRALDRVMAVAGDAQGAAKPRAAALKVLEGLADIRSLDLIMRVTSDSIDSLAAAAASAAVPFLRGPRGADVVECLTTIVLDSSRSSAVRIASLTALSSLEDSTIEPLRAMLANDPVIGLAGQARESVRTTPEETEEWMSAVLRGELPDEPAALAHAISNSSATLTLPFLHKLIALTGEREQREKGSKRGKWTAVRGFAHAALASRKSRLALYDLRDSVANAADPLPGEFLSALRRLGDAGCLESIAAGAARATHPAWRQQLIEAFVTIATREKVTRRHAVAKRIDKRWPSIASDLWAGRPAPNTPSRTRPR